MSYDSPAVVAAALAVFVICIAIDYIRYLLFKLLQVESSVNWIADKLAERFPKLKAQ